MTQLSSLCERMKKIESTDSQLIELLAKLPMIQYQVQDIPQFDRGETLPDIITPTPSQLSYIHALDACIRPQRVHSYKINMPKRFEGIIQFQASADVYEKVMKMAESSWQERKDLQAELIEAEPEARKRGRLTKQLYPGILFQTLRRRAPIAPFNTLGITSSWCDDQKGLRKVSPDEAISLIKAVNSSVPEWQAKRNQERIEAAPNIYKKTEIRVHPISILRYVNKQNKVQCDPKKTHSPIIVLTKTNSPINYVKLEQLDRTVSVQHSTMKNYKQLVENTCLYYRE